MKKLIALFACVFALCLAVAVQAENTAQPTLADKVEAVAKAQVDNARVVQLSVDTGSLPVEHASGKAVIVGLDKGNLVLLTSESLAMDIDILGDEPVLAKVYRNNKMVAHAAIKKIWADNTPANHHFYVVTLKGSAGMNFSKLSIQQAKKLL